MNRKTDVNLLIRNEDLMREWDWQENKDLDPRTLTRFSNKKAHWICKKGHKWTATISNRSYGKGCPYCYGNKVAEDCCLATVNPELAKEWATELNDKSPYEVKPSSSYYAWWRCKKGHVWKAKINNRANGKGCPICAKEIQTSFPEQATLFYLSKFFVTESPWFLSYDGKKYSFDIFIPSKKIAVEYDGVIYHSTNKKIERDIEKNEVCEKNNIQLFRIRELGLPQLPYQQNVTIIDCLNGKKVYTDNNLKQAILNLLNQLGLKIEIDIQRDKTIILGNYISIQKTHNINQNNFPFISQWNTEKNGTLTPELFAPNSHALVWWKCPVCNHEWQASIANRSKGQNCPVCSHRRLKQGINDFVTLFPLIAKEWDYEKNAQLQPSQFFAGSSKKVWWKCSLCGNSWQATINSRTQGRGCPLCGKSKQTNTYRLRQIQKKGSLLDNHPEIASEWNYGLNGDLLPNRVLSNTNESVWWTCSLCGYVWKTSVCNRTLHSFCPKCKNKPKR